jgi:2-polyprenyl-3-methyl-5-hydroxy-6-metoxy-1,4-benzoquinol methylase
VLAWSKALGGRQAITYDLIPQGEFDYIPKGSSVFGSAAQFLLVPKNRYKAVLLPQQLKSAERGVGWLTEDNSSEGYDLLWGNPDNLEAFRNEADGIRDKLTIEIVDSVQHDLASVKDAVDIGCGVGDLLAEVINRQPIIRLSGLDFSAKAVAIAAKRFPEGSFINHVITDSLPYDNGQFDLVLCTDVLEHLDYPQRIASELVRICRPGGLVVIVVPDGEVDQFLGHYWFWNQDSLSNMLADFNPQVIRLPETRELLARIYIPHVKLDENA